MVFFERLNLTSDIKKGLYFSFYFIFLFQIKKPKTKEIILALCQRLSQMSDLQSKTPTDLSHWFHHFHSIHGEKIFQKPVELQISTQSDCQYSASLSFRFKKTSEIVNIFWVANKTIVIYFLLKQTTGTNQQSIDHSLNDARHPNPEIRKLNICKH